MDPKYDVVWLAGVFEKGGSFSIRKSRAKRKAGVPCVRVRLRSVDYQLLATVVEVVNREKLAVYPRRGAGKGRHDGVSAPHRSWNDPNDPTGTVRYEVEWTGKAGCALVVSLLPHLHPHRAARFALVLARISG